MSVESWFLGRPTHNDAVKCSVSFMHCPFHVKRERLPLVFFLNIKHPRLSEIEQGFFLLGCQLAQTLDYLSTSLASFTMQTLRLTLLHPHLGRCPTILRLTISEQRPRYDHMGTTPVREFFVFQPKPPMAHSAKASGL